MAAAIGSHGAASYGGGDTPKPSAIVMAYTGHSDYSSDEPLLRPSLRSSCREAQTTNLLSGAREVDSNERASVVS
jgi:hypothetical protein